MARVQHVSYAAIVVSNCNNSVAVHCIVAIKSYAVEVMNCNKWPCFFRFIVYDSSNTISSLGLSAINQLQ